MNPAEPLRARPESGVFDTLSPYTATLTGTYDALDLWTSISDRVL